MVSVDVEKYKKKAYAHIREAIHYVALAGIEEDCTCDVAEDYLTHMDDEDECSEVAVLLNALRSEVKATWDVIKALDSAGEDLEALFFENEQECENTNNKLIKKLATVDYHGKL